MNLTIDTALKDEDLKERKQTIIQAATGPVAAPKTIIYLPHENKVWELVSTTLRPIWDKVVVDEALEAREIIKLPMNFVPQLSDVSKKLQSTSGFTYHAVGGLVSKEDFFGALANKSFLSTQYLRHPKNPLYTEEPDIIHEVIGHGSLLANTKLARLHQLAGEALVRVHTEQAKQFVADVWWFSGEFGVLRHSKGIKAVGAGLLSSVGELQTFDKMAEVRQMDIKAMGTTKYRIDDFQKVLFAADSVDHMMECVGGFFQTVTDEVVAEMLRK